MLLLLQRLLRKLLRRRLLLLLLLLLQLDRSNQLLTEKEPFFCQLAA
jgi:hypothetical protein